MEEQKKQFIYVLKLVPHLFEQSNWTNEDERIVGDHFAVLKGLTEEGKVVLAGRTLTMDENTFGIVILEVDSEEEARNIMENDPAVKHKVMTATLFPYRIALQRQTTG
ncbi:YciI family protein [Brevibacillus sp. SYSU BS000544]|uniref:YciI family protein n=1 Tax=Brevibacillus sp. SYSU BS000544 TaxID=3416443 RepID=UPI003CE480D8